MTDNRKTGETPRQETRPKSANGVTSGSPRGNSDGKSNDSLTLALRNNYQNTVDEGVPDIFQNLINKLK